MPFLVARPRLRHNRAHASSKVSRGCPAPNLDWTFGSPAAMIAPGSVRDGPSAHGRGLLRNADAGGAIMHVQDSSWAGDWGLVPLRLVVGLVFAVHGAQKLFVFGLGGAAGFMARVGIPLPSVAAVVVMAVEILGGLALILGLGTRLAAALLAIEMVVAILAVRLKMGFVGGYEFELTLLAASLSLVLLGAGPMTVKKVFARGAAPAPEARGSR